MSRDNEPKKVRKKKANAKTGSGDDKQAEVQCMKCKRGL